MRIFGLLKISRRRLEWERRRFCFRAGDGVECGFVVPQAVHLWRTKTAKGAPILLFAGFNALQAIGAVHRYFEHDYALMIGMVASLVTCGSVTGLAVRYR